MPVFPTMAEESKAVSALRSATALHDECSGKSRHFQLHPAVKAPARIIQPLR